MLQVPIASFDACGSQNAIGDPIMTGPANVTLDSPGDHYYICTFGRHCQAGQKLAITVSGTSTPAANPPNPSSPSPVSPPILPSPSATGPSGSTTPGGSNAPSPSS